MSDSFTIRSHSGPYTVHFDEDALARLFETVPMNDHFIVDSRVAELYEDALKNILSHRSVLKVQATETNKSLDKFSFYINRLVEQGVRRGHTLVAVGGGIIQDITAFLAAVLLRGLEWRFFPTTLLSQADSCIGSKSSVNVGQIKNLIGTFTPPREIYVTTRFLETLEEGDMRSGIGEILKVHIIDGPDSFGQIASDYNSLLSDRSVLIRTIRRSLLIKKRFIEEDEFDRGIRNVMNYGHSFGHAIESATRYGVPHGIAVTMGMDIANYVAVRYDRLEQKHYEAMHTTLADNFAAYKDLNIPVEAMLSALSKDKKNLSDGFNVILLDKNLKVGPHHISNDGRFRATLSDYFSSARA